MSVISTFVVMMMMMIGDILSVQVNIAILLPGVSFCIQLNVLAMRL